MTAATRSTSFASGLSRLSRRPTTSRTPSGRPIESGGIDVAQRPSLSNEHTGLGEMSKHLADEERISLGLVAHHASEVASPATLLLPGRPLEEVDDVVGGEPLQRHPLHALDPPEVGEHVGEGVATLRGRCLGRCRR